MINILIIFLNNIFKEKNMIKWSKSPHSAKGFRVQSFFQFIFSSVNKMDGKKTYGQLLQIKCLKEKRSFLGRTRQRDSLDNVLWESNLPMEKRIKLPWGTISLRKLNCFGEELLKRIKFLNVKQDNTCDKLCANQTFFISLENFWNLFI